ncbi:MAG: PD-(D/E)XK nuclease-like domain-containing protein [Micavibrio sp.]|nr:PD-(D/E)XK nuclease-like domain-containing protein [Micavibrio sp.]
MFWTDEASGLECKCRPDWWDGETIVDPKSTDDASPEGFRAECCGIQGSRPGCALHGRNQAKRFIFLAVEKQEPHAVGIYELDEISLEYAKEIRAQELATLAECKRTNIWPGYADGIQTIGLPSWAYKKTEETIEVNYV